MPSSRVSLQVIHCSGYLKIRQYSLDMKLIFLDSR